jgi:FkbM family methyltransferase
MKNPAANLWSVFWTWRRLRRYPGLFTLGDAALQLDRVLLPARFAQRTAARELARAARIRPADEGAFEIELLEHGLRFFWPREPDNNLWFLIEQEFDPRNPHYYTTPPIRLSAESLVLDVGACEGLLALRALKTGLARRVICFEPWETMAALLRRGARANGMEQQLAVEPLAVDRQSGCVVLQEGADAEASSIHAPGESGRKVAAVSLDDYCRAAGLSLSRRDLIKIDAEGADFAVLQGAEGLIRAGSPQIAVTTYHTDDHCFEIVDWLRRIQPRYRLRLKGFACWTQPPRPVLLQAALPDGSSG